MEFIQSKFLKNDESSEGKREFEELMTKLALEKGLGVENINGTYTVTTAGFKETTVSSVVSAAVPEQVVAEEPVANDVDDLLPYYNDKENGEEDLLNALGSNTSDPNFLDDEIGTAEADREIIVVDPSSSTLAPQPERHSERQSSTVIDDETFAILV